MRGAGLALDASDATIQQRRVERAVADGVDQVASHDGRGGVDQLDFAKRLAFPDEYAAGCELQTAGLPRGELHEIAIAGVRDALDRASVQTDVGDFTPN